MLHQHAISDTELNLDNGGHLSIDAFITPPYTLRVLSAYNNQLSEFPAGICLNHHLRVLNLSCNQITQIPAQIAQLPAVKCWIWGITISQMLHLKLVR
ncbi:leucine-rich repeat domain-containing protein [Morganella psychrotolerans]|uniref:leucine-rich repeat domain-containing protein n=1 Tax=Morganella psychrotolerans TaxID=368603 RepID=UPI000A5CC692|nr:leucine-rich repeat domain-containing protein [Morganella psychrotolerans]